VGSVKAAADRQPKKLRFSSHDLVLFSLFGTKRADKTITAPKTEIQSPHPTFVVKTSIHPIRIINASDPEIQANLRLTRPKSPVINEMGEPTMARSPNIVVTVELETRLLADDKSAVPK
jgi:hypothetical protein